MIRFHIPTGAERSLRKGEGEGKGSFFREDRCRKGTPEESMLWRILWGERGKIL